MKLPRINIATRTALFYLIFGGLWILLSDRILFFFLKDPIQLTRIQTYKGWLFVAASGFMVYGLLKHYLSIQQQLNQELREKSESYRLLFNSSLDAILLAAPEGNIFAANPAACKTFGRSQAEICAIGRNGLLDTSDPRLAQALEARAQTGSFTGELTFIRKDGTKFPGEISSSVILDSKGRQQISIIIRDVTERKEAEARIMRLNRLYVTLSQINQALVHIHDKKALFQEICRVTVEHGKFLMAWIGLVDPADNRVKPVTFFGQEQGYLDNIQIEYTDEALGRGPTGTSIRERRCIICKEIATDPSMGPWRERALQRGFQSMAAVPIYEANKIIGALSVYAAEPDFFHQEDESLLTEIGEDISFALDMIAAEDERGRMHEAISASRDRLNGILNSITDAFITVDWGWKITFVNAEAARINRKRPEEFIGKTIWEEWPSLVGTENEQRYRIALTERIPVHFEHHFSGGQSDTWLYVHAYPSEDGVTIYYQDITERKHSEASLRKAESARLESEERLRLALYAAQQGIYDLNVQTGEAIVSDIYATMLGFDPETFHETNAKWLERLHPDDIEPVGQVYRDYIAGKTSEYRVECRQRTAAGDWKWILSMGKIVEYDPEGRPLRMLGTHTDITESKNAALRIAHLLIENAQLIERLQCANEELTHAYDATIEGWSLAMDLRDRETEGHTQRVTAMTVALAQKMGIPEAEIDHFRRGALLHDIGKMGIPDSILLKPGLLTEEERKIIQRHPQYAFDMLQSIGYLRPALDIPHYHHEKWDGTGYPYGMKGEEIPLPARLFAVIDVFDALTTDRPYRKAWSKPEAVVYLASQSGKHFDPDLLRVFLDFLGENFPEASVF